MTKQFWCFVGIIAVFTFFVAGVTESATGALLGLIAGCLFGFVYLVVDMPWLTTKFNQLSDGLEKGPHSPE